MFYNGYGTTVASVLTSSDSTWNSLPAGTFRDLSLQWTCPTQDAGMPLDIMLIFRCGTEQVSMDNVQLKDLTENPVIPTAPTGLTATAVSSNQVNLNWTDTANDETGFQIDRSTSADFSQNLTSVTTTGTTTSYTDTNVSPGTTYYYRVWASNNGSLSTSPTNSASVVTNSGPFTIPNFSFENPAQSNGGYTSNTITNWTIGTTPTSYSAGVQNNTGAGYFSSVPDGSQFAYVNADSNSSGYQSSNTLTSSVLGTVSGGQTYTLTAAVGNRLDSNFANNGTYTVSLLDGGTVLASQTYAGSSISPGTWHDLSVTYAAPTNVATGNLQVQLGFSTAGYTAGNVFGQGDFDDVQLSSAAANAPPQPPSGLTATAVSASQINLSWTDNSNNETGFKIDQATSSDFTQNLVTHHGRRQLDHLQRDRSGGEHYVLLPRAGHQHQWRFGQHLHGQRHDRSAPVSIPIPDGDFKSDSAGNDINTNSGGGMTFSSAMNGTLAGWSISCQPQHRQRRILFRVGTVRGGRQYRRRQLLEPVCQQRGVHLAINPRASYPTPSCITLANVYDYGNVVGGAQPGASLTMTTTGINATAVTGNLYTAHDPVRQRQPDQLHRQRRARTLRSISWPMAWSSARAPSRDWPQARRGLTVTATWAADCRSRRPGDPTPGGGEQLPRRTWQCAAMAGAHFGFAHATLTTMAPSQRSERSQRSDGHGRLFEPDQSELDGQLEQRDRLQD